jgi:DNA repair protein RadD
MVFAATVKHAMECMESLPPELSRMIGGDINTKKEQRKKLVNDFKQQKYKYLVSVGTMTTGVDFTHVDLIALMRATESIGLLKQCIGRGLRLHEGKTDCLVLDYAENIERHCGEDGDIFNPKISAKKASGGGEGLSVICPSCETENEFTARPNPDGFKMDSSGYFLDLMGERIDTPYGPMPSHMGRRCFGMQLVLGKLERCLYRWSPKKCPHCFADNDIAARYCSECKGEIVDPNNSLIDIYKPAVKDPYQQQTERVIAWHTKKQSQKKMRIC